MTLHPDIAAVIDGESEGCIVQGNCLEIMRKMPENSVDLVFGSPPYEDARTYGIDFRLKGQGWVDWMVKVVHASLRVCKGLVAFVVEGKTKNFRWSATPVLLMADLHRAGVHLRKPPIFHRVGIPGSGGPDWLRNDWEFVVCCTNGGRLLWSDNTAMGMPPQYETGGRCSNRHVDGRRANESRYGALDARTPSEAQRKNGAKGNGGYTKPKISNPGNVIHCKVGGGHMGSKLAHKNEAPFPEALAEFFVKSFCPPGGVTLDPLCGSGTSAAVAYATGRRYLTIDVRQSQVDLSHQRIRETQRPLPGL